MKLNREIVLYNPKYCNGCPCSVELMFQAHCLLYKIEVMLDKDTVVRQNFMKRLRPIICIRENEL